MSASNGTTCTTSHDAVKEPQDQESRNQEQLKVESNFLSTSDHPEAAPHDKHPFPPPEQYVNSECDGDSTAKEGASGDSVESSVRVEDVTLKERSPTSLDRPRPHPLSVDTSDSEASVPRYSPGLYTSGDEGGGDTYPLPSSPSVSPSPSLLEDHAPMSILFAGITYLGCSSVDAPVSEVEANRKMYTLKSQAANSKPMPVIVSIPVSNDGNVILKDTESEHPLSIFAVKMILFCARGNAEQLLDCFCLNVKHKRSGIYSCHAFRCEIPEACQKIFEAIGKAFKTKPIDRNLPPLTDEKLVFEFNVKVDISEDDGKGGFSPALYEKDCFKLRLNLNKTITLTVTQGSNRPIIVERCFGLLISPVQVVKGSEMNLLDNMSCTYPNSHTFSVSGLWDTSSYHLTALNQDTKVLGYKFVTIAADLVLESVTEPIRFKREVKVSIKPAGGISNLSRGLIIKLNKKAQEIGSSESFELTLEKCEEDGSNGTAVYSVAELAPLGEAAQTSETSQQASTVNQTDSGTDSTTTAVKKKSGYAKTNKDEQPEEETRPDDDVIVSGWGDVDDTREDLLQDWGQMLEEWDGRDRDKPKPSKLIKLCSKGIPRHLRCQVWQMLTGASYDPQLKEAYRLLIMKESPAENVIHWDIKRTYVGHDYFQEASGREALYKICKAYSVYDEEVGYCQGFSFMAATLLLQKMPEEEAFSVMVKILYQYGHRELFKVNFQYLHLMFFQLDRLLEEQMSRMYEHFKENRIETHMFASQWFLTLYTAKFPLSLVFRILDIYLCEGIQVVFRVALGLLKIASHDLLGLDFEGILNYFRVSLPKKFQAEEDAAHLFHQMKQFKISEKKLAKYEKEHQLYLEQQAQLEDPVMRLERENKELRDSVMRLEGENDNLAQELVASKVTLRQEMDRLEERIDTLSKECRAHKTSADLSQLMLKEVREELQQAKEEYQKVLVQLMEEKMQHDTAISEYKQLFQQLDEGHQKEKGELSQELLEVKAQLGKASVYESQETGDHHSSLSSEERLRKLELELAQTKLALVESQCKNQELERAVQQLSTSQKGTFSYSFRKKK